MNNEIKEILESLDEVACCSYHDEMCKKAKNYITNLQQENERLKELDENYPIEEELAEAYRREEDYKSRIEKAVEYGNNCLEMLKDQDNYMCESIDIVELLRMIHKNYIDILNGRSDE